MSSDRSIVVVDDDRRVRESIQSVAESAGYAPRTFASAEELLESDALDQTRCVIADVRMSGIDGLELQRRIRARRPRLPVIFITAHDDDGVRRQAFEGGAADFLCKPFDGAELLGALSRALQRS
jgi:FixJ family two-component response regulator